MYGCFFKCTNCTDLSKKITACTDCYVRIERLFFVNVLIVRIFSENVRIFLKKFWPPCLSGRYVKHSITGSAPF